MATHPAQRLSEEEYLAIERAAEFKSEFVNGEMFAMAGGTMRHARLQGNIYFELRSNLQGGHCDVFNSEVRVKVSTTNMYTYPDVTVVCGKPSLADAQQDTLVNPTVIFEVLSPSTEGYDRGAKFQHYRTIESLKDYVLVEQSKMWVEHYTLGPDNVWVLRDHQNPQDELKIDSIGVSIPLARIYDRVEFSSAE